MSAERDAVPPHRRGPRGRSVAARSGAARSGKRPARPTEALKPAEVSPAESEETAETAEAAPVLTAVATADAPEHVSEAVSEDDAATTDAVETDAEPETADEAPADTEPADTEPAVEEPADTTEPDVDDTDEAAAAAPPAEAAKKPRGGALVRRVLPTRAAALPVGTSEFALSVRGLTKTFGPTVAVDAVDLDVRPGTFFGFVGPNGAGKTTTLSMITGLLRPDAGTVHLGGADMWANPAVAKRSLGVLPDRLRLFDRLTGREFLHHAGALRGLDRDTVTQRIDDLAHAFGIEHSLGRFVSDYSAGLVKKIGIAAALLHSPRLLVLDEPFESVDPVSAVAVIGILKKFAAAGGTVVLSSHSMDLIERECDAVGIIADGRMLAAGTMDEVRDGKRLEDRFVELAGGEGAVAGMEWLQAYTE